VSPHSYSDLEISQQPDVEWFIDGLVPAIGLTLLVGRGGSGKSFVALDWLMSSAKALTWQSRTMQCDQGVYVYAEGNFKPRVAAWRVAHGILETEDLGVSFVPKTVNLLDDGSVERFIRFVGKYKSAIVLDTYSHMVAGADENSPGTAGQAVAACRHIINETEAAVILVHHTPWSGDQRPRGHSRLPDASDAVLLLENKGGALKLTSQKQREAALAPPVHLQLVKRHGSLVVERAEAAPPPTDELRAKVGGDAVSVDELAKRLNTTPTARRRIDEAVTAGLMMPSGGTGSKFDPRRFKMMSDRNE
jgi:hypothetical protein